MTTNEIASKYKCAIADVYYSSTFGCETRGSRIYVSTDNVTLRPLFPHCVQIRGILQSINPEGIDVTPYQEVHGGGLTMGYEIRLDLDVWSEEDLDKASWNIKKYVQCISKGLWVSNMGDLVSDNDSCDDDPLYLPVAKSFLEKRGGSNISRPFCISIGWGNDIEDLLLHGKYGDRPAIDRSPGRLKHIYGSIEDLSGTTMVCGIKTDDNNIVRCSFDYNKMAMALRERLWDNNKYDITIFVEKNANGKDVNAIVGISDNPVDQTLFNPSECLVS